MKQTKKIIVENRIFTLDDLKRIAEVFDEQQKRARRSNHHATTTYEVQFSDNTSIESDSTEILNDNVFDAPGRPVELRFTFHNHSIDRHMSFSISHGDSTYGNTASITAAETTWVNDNFAKIKKAIDTAKPQTFWFRSHPALLLHFLSFGLGSLFLMTVTALAWAIVLLSGTQDLKISVSDEWKAIFFTFTPLWYIPKWWFLWFVGFPWAFGLRDWLFRLWPNIEIDLGVEHLKTERIQRRRLVTVLSVIVFPIITAAIYDILAYAF